jgi:hypothetical protein
MTWKPWQFESKPEAGRAEAVQNLEQPNVQMIEHS